MRPTVRVWQTGLQISFDIPSFPPELELIHLSLSMIGLSESLLMNSCNDAAWLASLGHKRPCSLAWFWFSLPLLTRRYAPLEPWAAMEEVWRPWSRHAEKMVWRNHIEMEMPEWSQTFWPPSAHIFPAQGPHRWESKTLGDSNPQPSNCSNTEGRGSVLVSIALCGRHTHEQTQCYCVQLLVLMCFVVIVIRTGFMGVWPVWPHKALL